MLPELESRIRLFIKDVYEQTKDGEKLLDSEDIDEQETLLELLEWSVNLHERATVLCEQLNINV